MVCLSECDRLKISVLSAFRVKPDIAVSLPYSAKMLLDALFEFSEMMAMLSAYANVLILQFLDRDRDGMFLIISMFHIKGSIAIMKRAQLNASPCLTPL